jgi:hypothetical protein
MFQPVVAPDAGKDGNIENGHGRLQSEKIIPVKKDFRS